MLSFRERKIHEPGIKPPRGAFGSRITQYNLLSAGGCHGCGRMEKEGSIAIIYMNNGENSIILISRSMLSALDGIKADPSITATVLTSTDPKNFSLGIDVTWLGERMNAKDNQAIKISCTP